VIASTCLLVVSVLLTVDAGSATKTYQLGRPRNGERLQHRAGPKPRATGIAITVHELISLSRPTAAQSLRRRKPSAASSSKAASQPVELRRGKLQPQPDATVHRERRAGAGGAAAADAVAVAASGAAEAERASVAQRPDTDSAADRPGSSSSPIGALGSPVQAPAMQVWALGAGGALAVGNAGA